jgi:hypothetical protein
MAGLDPAIHASALPRNSAWMPGERHVLGPAFDRTQGPGMTAMFVGSIERSPGQPFDKPGHDE